VPLQPQALEESAKGRKIKPHQSTACAEAKELNTHTLNTNEDSGNQSTTAAAIGTSGTR
jgi:hypothetical protein